MKKYKARKEREQQEAIVRPRIEIEDPSAELFSSARPWDHDDPLQDSFLDTSEVESTPKDYNRIPKLKFRSGSDTPPVPTSSLRSHESRSQSIPQDSQRYRTGSDTSLSEESPVPIEMLPPGQVAAPEVVEEPYSMETVSETQTAPQYQSAYIPIKSKRSRSLPPTPSLAFSPPKASFQLFTARCAPSPTSASPIATTPVFELSADEATFSLTTPSETSGPVELDAGTPEPNNLCPAPLNVQNKSPADVEPEASPYNRLTAFAKSIHNMNASLSTIAETEEEAASRRSSMALVHELPTMQVSPKMLSAYMGGTSITPRASQYNNAMRLPELDSLPTRNISTRSSKSTDSTANSMHSIFSFEYSNSDTEKIYIAAEPPYRRESSAPSLTDVSSVDDFDLDLELDLEARRTRSISKRDAKLERFFGIRQYSISTDSDAGVGTDTKPLPNQITSPPPVAFALDKEIYVPRRSSSLSSRKHGHKRSSSSTMMDEIEFTLALEHDPVKKEIMSMKKSLLNKSQSKQDAKLEKFFGCGKDQIQVARKFSTGSRLAGHTDDLQYRTVGWELNKI